MPNILSCTASDSKSDINVATVSVDIVLCLIPVARLKRKAWYLDTRGFIPKKDTMAHTRRLVVTS